MSPNLRGSNMSATLYLTGAEALTIATMTGLLLRTGVHKGWEPSDIHPDGVQAWQGAYLDITRLDWFDRMRVAFARIAAHHFVRAVGA